MFLPVKLSIVGIATLMLYSKGRWLPGKLNYLKFVTRIKCFPRISCCETNMYHRKAWSQSYNLWYFLVPYFRHNHLFKGTYISNYYYSLKLVLLFIPVCIIIQSTIDKNYLIIHLSYQSLDRLNFLNNMKDALWHS